MQKTMNAKNLLMAAFAFVMAVMLSLSMAVSSAFAANSYVLDNYGVLSADQSAQLESKASQISQSTGVGAYLVYVSNIGSSSVRDYAKQFYLANGLGVGSDKSGIMFLIAVDSRDYVTITYGKGVNAFTDDYISTLEDAVTEELHSNNWYEAGSVYLTQVDTAASYYAANGEAYVEKPSPLFHIVIALVIALVAAFLVVSAKKSQMKTAVQATEANDYLDQGSFVLESADDQFMGTTVICIKTAAESRNESHGSFVDSGGFGGSSGGKF